VKRRHSAASPDRGRISARTIGENIAIAISTTRGDDDADFIGAEIVTSCRAGWIDGDDDARALRLRDYLRSATCGLDDLVTPECRLKLIDIDAFIKAFALALRQIGEAFQKFGRKIGGIIRRVKKAANIIFRVGKLFLGDGIA
jgi:hypothetical protein